MAGVEPIVWRNWPGWQQEGLPAGDVRLVRVPHGDGDLATSRRVLSDEELSRAAALSSAQALRRFVVTRAALRALLGALCGEAPEAVPIGCEARGKPVMLRDRYGVRFNVSHGRDVSLLAFATEREVGVDIEEIKAGNDVLGIARRFFPAAEADYLGALKDDGERCRVFHELWTQREALAKGVGSGLDEAVFYPPLLPPGEQRRVVRLGAAANWRLWSLPPAERHAMAVAVEGEGDARLTFWEMGNNRPV